MCILHKHKNCISAAVFSACTLVAADCLALPEYVCVKAGKSTHHNNIPGDKWDDKIRVDLKFPLRHDAVSSYTTDEYILGLHDNAYCWKVSDAMAAIEKEYLYNDDGRLRFHKGKEVVLDVWYGKDCNIGKCCDIEPGTVAYYLIDRQPGNHINYWWCTKYKCPLVTGDSLPGHLHDKAAVDEESERCYDGMTYSEYAGIRGDFYLVNAVEGLLLVASAITGSVFGYFCRSRLRREIIGQTP